MSSYEGEAQEKSQAVVLSFKHDILSDETSEVSCSQGCWIFAYEQDEVERD
jgi:hypothetical protein